MNQITHTEWIGSKLIIKDHELKNIVTNLHEEITGRIKQSDSYIDTHNAFTAYTVMLLFSATGHRPVLDPFCFKSAYCLDLGMMLIDDKAVSESHRYRLVTLPPIAIEQLKEYEKHLKWLLCPIIDKNLSPSPKYAISQILNPNLDDKKQTLPLFFFLSKKNSLLTTVQISETELKNQLGETWPIPYNTSRHVIATRLRRMRTTNKANGLTIEAIEAHLGHMQGLQHPFGSASVISPEENKEQINSPLNELLLSQNWSILKAKQQYRNIDNIKPCKWKHSTEALGPIARQNWRELQRINDEIAVNEAFSMCNENELISNKQHALSIINIIVEQSDNDKSRIRNRLSIYWKKILEIKKRKPNFKIPRRPHIIETEPSPFTSNTLTSYKTAKQLRQNFISYLQNQGKHTVLDKNRKITYYRRLSEIIISAALFDHISNSYVLNALGNSILDLKQEGNIIFLDIFDSLEKKNTSSLLWRWLPQPLSISLVTGINSKLNINLRPKTINLEKLQCEIVNVLSEIGSSNLNKNTVIKQLAKFSLNFWIIHSPPFLREVSAGNTPVKPLPESALVRLIRNERLVDKSNPKVRITKRQIYVNAEKYSSNVNNSYNRLNNARLYRTHLTDDIKQADKLKGQGRKGKSRVQKEELEKRIRSKLVMKHKYPSIAVAIGSWAIKLCTVGTDLYGPIKFSTIKSYTNMVANALLEITFSDNFFNLSPEIYDDYYNIAFNIATQKGVEKIKLVNNLSDFHNFLVASNLAPELDWCGFRKNTYSGLCSSSVSANIITLSEHLQIIHRLKKMGDEGICNKRTVMQYCSILICGYRFGLRISESIHLQYRDIQHNADWSFIVLNIKNTYHGDTKSPSGRRQIPLTERLTPEETIILRAVLNQPLTTHNDVLASIYSIDEDSHELIDEVKTSQVLQATLKKVTGDPTSHYHLLRHSYNCRIYLKLFDIYINNLTTENRSNINKINQLISGRNNIGSHTLKSLSVITGHSNITTTFRNYIHTADFHIHAITGKQKYWDPLSVDRVAYIISYATGEVCGNVEREQSRKEINSKNLLSSLNQANTKTCLSSPCTETTQAPLDEDIFIQSHNSPQTLTLKDIDVILLTYYQQKGVNSAVVTENFMLPLADVNQVITSFKILKDQIGFTGYKTLKETEDKILRDFDKYTQAETNTLQPIFASITKMLQTHDKDTLQVIKSGMRSWSKAYYDNNRYRPLIFNNPDNLIDYLKALSLMGIETSSLRVSVSSREAEWYKYQTSTKDGRTAFFITLKNVNKYYFNNGGISKTIPLLDTKERNKSRLSICLDKNSKHKYYVQKRLDRVCFLVLIWLEFRANKS